MPEAALSDAVIAALREDFLDSEVLQDLIHEQRARWKTEPDEQAAQRREITARLAEIGVELGNLTEAIVGGKAPVTIVKAIEQREATSGSYKPDLIGS